MAKYNSLNQNKWVNFQLEDSAYDYGTSQTKPIVQVIGGIFRTVQPTYTDGDAAVAHFTNDGKLMVDTELTLNGNVISNIKSFSTDNTEANSAYGKVNAAQVPYALITNTTATASAVPVAGNTVGVADIALPVADANVLAAVSSTGYVDDAAGFTVAASKGTVVMGLATADSVDANDVGALRMTTARNLGVDISSQSLTAVAVSKDQNANAVGNAMFTQLSDQTTGVNVIAATNALKTDLSSIAGTATAVNSGALDAGTQRVTIATNDPVLATPTTLTGGAKTVTNSGTAEALGGALSTKTIYIRAKSSNTGNVYVGDSSVDAVTNKQIILAANDSMTLSISDRATVYVDVDVNGEGVDYLATG